MGSSDAAAEAYVVAPRPAGLRAELEPSPHLGPAVVGLAASERRSGSAADRLSGRGVTVAFDGLSALADVSFELRAREIQGLIGPNGAGKTTLVNAITGFQKLTSGAIWLGDQRLDGASPETVAQHGVARTFQAGRLFGSLTAEENIELAGIGAGLGRRAARASARELGAWLGLATVSGIVARRLPYSLQRRVGVARALAGAPSFLLLDEPAAGMSEGECDDLIQHLREIPARQGCGILLIEHNMRVIMQACRRIHVLNGGSTIMVGSPEEVKSDARVLAAYLGAGAGRARP
jgi:branched-chain amino acid transport system ATP-binding protein